MAEWDVVDTKPADNPWRVKSTAPVGSMSWGDVGTQAMGNVVPSAVNLAKDLAAPIVHPVETSKNLTGLALGGMEKVRDAGPVANLAMKAINPFQGLYDVARNTGIVDSGNAKNVDAVVKFLRDRYGGIEEVKKTLATDPVGVLADMSMVVSGGGTAAARAPILATKLANVAKAAGMSTRVVENIEKAGQIAAKGGEYAQKAGQAIDPVHTAVVKPLKGAAEAVGGLFTQTGGEPLRIAARAGAAGGPMQLPWKSAPEGQAFLRNLRGQAPLEETVAAANQGLQNLRGDASRQYLMDKTNLAKSTTPLGFTDIDAAVANTVKKYKGVSISPSVESVQTKIADAVAQWKALDPANYHTAEGLDALKQLVGDIGGIGDKSRIGTPEYTATKKVYDAIKKTIMAQDPSYGKMMEAYENAKREIGEIEKTLSLKPNAAIYTKLRKLQASLRDNVNTSFGRHKEMADLLVRAGAPHLMERLAGQALKPWTPRGLAKLGAEIMAFKVPAMLGVTSPRLMGEAAYKIGQASRYMPPPRAASAVPGRLSEVLDPREIFKNEARDALQDKSVATTKDERELLRRAALGSASADDLLKVQKLLDRGAATPDRATKSSYGGIL